jgi:hypothetical protein
MNANIALTAKQVSRLLSYSDGNDAPLIVRISSIDGQAREFIIDGFIDQGSVDGYPLLTAIEKEGKTP